MLELIMWLYNTTFSLLFNSFILYYFVKKLRTLIFRDKEINRGYVVITGCDTGFGYDAAYELSKRGIFVFACCLTTESVDRFNKDGSFKGKGIQMNVTKEEDVLRARQIIEKEVGEEGIWCLVNNAGIGTPGPIEWMSMEDMKQTMEVNLWGVVNVTKIMLPLVKKARGRIVNTSSMAGRLSPPFVSSYSMSKYALEAFSDSLRHEMRPWGVTVHIIEPGFHRTNILNLDKRWDTLWDAQSKETQEQYGVEFFKALVRKGEKTKFQSADPKNVVKAYLHATLSSRPELRYLIGLDANTICILIATLPTAFGDFLQQRLTSRKLMPAATKNMK